MEGKIGEMDLMFGEMDKRFGEIDKRFGEIDLNSIIIDRKLGEMEKN